MKGYSIFFTVLLCNLGLSSVKSAISVSAKVGRDSPSPCDTCPRQGKCVPKVSCPSHLRQGASNLECHLGEEIGICCYGNNAAASERKTRSYKSIDRSAEKKAHKVSKDKWNKNLKLSQKVLEHSNDTVVEQGSPDFRHSQSLADADDNTNALGEGAFLNLFALQDLKEQQAIDDDDVDMGYSVDYNVPYCPPEPSCLKPPPYRSTDGACNNPSNPTWGAANTAYERLLPPDYDDGIWSLRTSKCNLGSQLPSARAISASLLPDGHYPSETHNLLFMQFCQFIAHDVTSAVINNIGNGSAISCCSKQGSPLPPELLHWACAPVAVDPADEFYGHFERTCLNFVRAQLAPSPDCSSGYAKQMNGVTHFLDLSQLYGNSENKQAVLRDGGYLKVFNDYGRHLPPLTDRAECLFSKEEEACFDSGDHHGNQIISLTAFHTLFTRQHNRVAAALSRLQPACADDVVFHKSKLVVQAIYQHIVYNEWLPLLVGRNLMQLFNLGASDGYSSAYDPGVNPSVLAEFAAAAMRFGHSTVDGKIKTMCPVTGATTEEISISEVMFQPGRMRLRMFLDQLLAGMSAHPMQTVDPFITIGLTRYLFRGGNAFGLDLATLNIQRGRDFGLRPFNDYRRLVGLKPYLDFNELPYSVRKRLSTVYACPDDIDLWIGGLLEKPVPGGVIGPTFANIILEQFSRFKKGDRFHYEYGPEVNPGAFTLRELAEIKKITMARIICDNSDGIELTSMPHSAFLRADLNENRSVKCEDPAIPSLDLSQFELKC